MILIVIFILMFILTQVGLLLTLRLMIINSASAVAEPIAVRIDGVAEQLKLATKRQKKLISSTNFHGAKLDALWESLPVAMFLTDADAMPLAVNQAYIRIWGFDSAEQAKTDEWLNLLTPISYQKAVIRHEFINNVHDQFSYTMQLKCGKWLKVIGYPIWDDPHREIFIGYSGVVIEVDDEWDDGDPTSVIQADPASGVTGDDLPPESSTP